MIPAAFDYVRATSLAHALELLDRNEEDARILAGGHTLIPSLKLRLDSPSLLVDIGRINKLKGIEIDGGYVKIGALTTHADLHNCVPLNEVFPIFRQAAGVIADPQVRNRGTIGGALVNADPAADWPAVILALQAELEIASSRGTRRLPANEFFIDLFTTTLQPGEVLTAIHIAEPMAGSRFAYRKIRHPASGYAIVGVAVAIVLREQAVEKICIGITGAANCAFAARGAASFLVGKPLSRENIATAAKLASEGTICLSDGYAPAEYRSHLIKTELSRALLALGS